MRIDKKEKDKQVRSLDVAQDEGVAFAEQRLRKNRTSRLGAVLFSIIVFTACFLAVYLPTSGLLGSLGALLAGLGVGALSLLTVHIALQWEQAVILRFGKFNRVVGPGIYFTIPIIEYVTLRVDQRMRCTFFSGEQILTSDLVPVDVDAVFFWTVWNARKASTEVEDYLYSVSNAAQACMRDVVGNIEMEELSTRRKQIDKEIRDQIAEITEPWGISVTAVKIRDIIVPKDLQDALSKAAQAQRERDARIILAEVEKDISSMLVEAARIYDENEHAIQLRAMHAVSGSLKDNGGVVVVPSSLGDSFGNAADFLKRL